MENKINFLRWFREIDKNDVGLVGGKGANLGEMTQAGVPVPPGFVVTAEAYFYFLYTNQLGEKIRNFLKQIDVNQIETLQVASRQIKNLIIHSPIPKEISQTISRAYFQLNEEGKNGLYKFKEKILFSLKSPFVAIRSSATAEDLPEASFAGQQETFLNIHGEANVIKAVRDCWASLFEARAIFYREENHFDHFKVGLAAVVQEMIPAEISGIMFTVDPLDNDKRKIIIEAIYGLGDLIVSGGATPDHYEIDKDKLLITDRLIAKQEKQLTRDKARNGGEGVKTVEVSKKMQDKQKLNDSQIIKLAILGRQLEKHYYHPQDIEWAVHKGQIYILQTRPVTTLNQSSKIKNQKQEKILLKEENVILRGQGASPGIKSGSVTILNSPREINKIHFGDILVAEKTTPDYVPAMKKAVAIVTNKGGRTCHAAIVSRELGVPAIVGTEIATKILKNGQIITVDGSSGKIYKGGLPVFAEKPKISAPIVNMATTTSLLKTATKIYVNLAESERAEEISHLPVDGIGLLRAEFMMAQIGLHPKEIIKERKQKLFVKTLSENMSKFCEHFSPRPVIYRFSDFKTNEYRGLKGGKDYEPEEENPFLGFRGALRYIKQPEVFRMELEAIKIVRNKMGYHNLWVMVPFARTVMELMQVKSLMAEAELRRSPSFKIFLMVEIPANVILLEKFIEVGIDGVSIGSNDLTMLILGADRDNNQVAGDFDERNEAVLWALERTIKICQKYKITSSICGQAASEYPDLVEKLVKWGITSVSVNPDAVERTRQLVAEMEAKL